MTEWVVLSDRKAAPAASGCLDRGLFVLEFSLPLDRGTVLLDSQSDKDGPRSFSVFADPETGFSLLHRRGSQFRRHALPGVLPPGAGRGRLSFAFDAAARFWTLRFTPLNGDAGGEASGTDPLRIPRAPKNGSTSPWGRWEAEPPSPTIRGVFNDGLALDFPTFRSASVSPKNWCNWSMDCGC